MTTIEVLRKARELVSAPGAWTQRAFARDALGGDVGPTSQFAKCWCSAGAVACVVGDMVDRRYHEAVNAIVAASGWMSIAGFNDAPERTQADVLAAFDRAIAAAEASS